MAALLVASRGAHATLLGREAHALLVGRGEPSVDNWTFQLFYKVPSTTFTHLFLFSVSPFCVCISQKLFFSPSLID